MLACGRVDAVYVPLDFRPAQPSGVTHSQIVPTTLFRLLDFDSRDNYDFSSLQLIGYASAPIPGTRAHQAIEAFRGTRVADIARSARVTPATFYRHFASKDSVFEIMVRKATDDAVVRLRRVPPGVDAAHHVVLLVRAYVWQCRRNARLFDADQQRSREAVPTSAVHAEVAECFIELFHGKITQVQQAAELGDNGLSRTTAEFWGQW